MNDSLLKLSGFGVGFGESVLLVDVDLEIKARGITVLMGPAGAGKSTLLRTLAGFNDAQPSFHTWGQATFLGQTLGQTIRPALVAQKATLVMATVFDNLLVGIPGRSDMTRQTQRKVAVQLLERAKLSHLTKKLDDEVVDLPLHLQRRLSITRTAAADPALLCVDEPTASLQDQEAADVLDLLAQLAEERAVLIVTHNQKRAAVLGGNLVLLAGGRVQETQPTLRFLRAPKSVAGKAFVSSGSCSVPSPSATRESLAPDVEPPPPLPPRHAASYHQGPRGFHWADPGRLAGTPRPGLLVDVELDLDALRRVGVTLLVCLEEKCFILEPLLNNFGITGLSFPIEDMGAPVLNETADFCRLIERRLQKQSVVAYHCRAGHGRTGTMLAAQLITRGGGALETLEQIRFVQPRWVQSPQQIDFLTAYAKHIASHHHPKTLEQSEPKTLEQSEPRTLKQSEQPPLVGKESRDVP